MAENSSEMPPNGQVRESSDDSTNIQVEERLAERKRRYWAGFNCYGSVLKGKGKY